jgi:ketosteroid isomerase-like protein
VSRGDPAIIRSAFEAGSLREAAQKYWHPDIEYVEDPRWPGASRYRGRDSVVSCFEGYMDALGGEVAVVVEQIRAAGKRQVAFVRFEGQSPSGLPHEHLWAYIVELRDGLIAYLRAYYEPDDALEAAGVGGYAG